MRGQIPALGLVRRAARVAARSEVLEGIRIRVAQGPLDKVTEAAMGTVLAFIRAAEVAQEGRELMQTGLIISVLVAPA